MALRGFLHVKTLGAGKEKRADGTSAKRNERDRPKSVDDIAEQREQDEQHQPEHPGGRGRETLFYRAPQRYEGNEQQKECHGGKALGSVAEPKRKVFQRAEGARKDAKPVTE